MPTIIPTVTRMPRIQGFPPMTLGSNVILVNAFTACHSRPDVARPKTGLSGPQLSSVIIPEGARSGKAVKLHLVPGA
jgi:hypothetical protein